MQERRQIVQGSEVTPLTDGVGAAPPDTLTQINGEMRTRIWLQPRIRPAGLQTAGKCLVFSSASGLDSDIFLTLKSCR